MSSTLKALLTEYLLKHGSQGKAVLSVTVTKLSKGQVSASVPTIEKCRFGHTPKPVTGFWLARAADGTKEQALLVVAECTPEPRKKAQPAADDGNDAA